jgi:hypothetical protein
MRLAIVELGAGHLGVGVDEGLPPRALQVADLERVLSSATARSCPTRHGPPCRSWPCRRELFVIGEGNAAPSPHRGRPTRHPSTI